MKYFRRILIVATTAFILSLMYLEFGGRFILKTNDKRVITFSIRSSGKLPDNFSNFYNTVYLNSLSENSWNYTFNALLKSQSPRKECPCNQMAYRLFPRLDIKNRNGIDYFPVARYIEQNYSQEECLNFNFSNFDFLEGRKGIREVSKSLFNKDIKDLNHLEMGEILALYENPVRNNRYRNPERAQTKAQYFNYLYLQNSNQ